MGAYRGGFGSANHEDVAMRVLSDVRRCRAEEQASLEVIAATTESD